MAHEKVSFYLLTILATLNLLLAQEGSGQYEPSGAAEQLEDPSPNERASQPGLGSIFGGFANFPGFGNIPSFGNMPGFGNIPGFGSLQGLFPFFIGPTSSTTAVPSYVMTTAPAARRKRSPQDESSPDTSDNESRYNESDDEEDVGPHSRFFFSSLFNTRLVTCNYTTQPGNTCASCKQTLTCFPSNVGKLRTCKKFFPYCNNGRCSIFRGAACDPTTTAAATTATATNTAATTATTG